MFSTKEIIRISPSIIQFINLSVLTTLGQVDPSEVRDNAAILDSSSKISQLSQILDSVVHPGDVVILTESIAEFSSSHVQVFSRVSIAIVNWNTSYTSSSFIREWPASLLSGRGKPFIMLDFPREILQIRNTSVDEGRIQASTRDIQFSTFLNQLLQEKQKVKWKPTILIIVSWKSSSIESIQVSTLNFHYEILEKLVQNVRFQFDSNVYPIFLEGDAEDKIRLSVWEIYDIKMKRIISPVSGFKNSGIGFNLEAFATRRRDLHLGRLTASVRESPESNRDWGDVRMREDGTYYLDQSYIAVIYWELGLLLNFSESIVIGDSPIVLPNGTLSGKTIDQLNNDEADFSLNKLSLNPQRASGLSFLHPTHRSLPYVFFKQPAPNSIRDNVTGPFKPKLWFSLMALGVLLAISIKFRLLMMPQKGWKRFPLNSFERRDDERFARESLLWIICALCQKSWYLDPKSFSLKMQFMLGSLTALIVYTAYSTFIVSTLAVASTPVNSFLDLLQSNFVFTVHELSQPFHSLLQSMINMNDLEQSVHKVSTEEEISHLFQPLPPSIILSSLERQSGEVKSTQKAFLSYADMFYKTAEFLNYSSTFICHHVSSFKIDVGFNLRKSALVVKKGGQFKEILNYMLVFLINYGLTYRNDDIYNSRNILMCPLEEQMVPVDAAEFSDISIIILLLFVGALLALLVLVFELIVCHRYCVVSKYNDKQALIRQQRQLFFANSYNATYYFK